MVVVVVVGFGVVVVGVVPVPEAQQSNVRGEVKIWWKKSKQKAATSQYRQPQKTTK